MQDQRKMTRGQERSKDFVKEHNEYALTCFRKDEHWRHQPNNNMTARGGANTTNDASHFHQTSCQISSVVFCICPTYMERFSSLSFLAYFCYKLLYGGHFVLKGIDRIRVSVDSYGNIIVQEQLFFSIPDSPRKFTILAALMHLGSALRFQRIIFSVIFRVSTYVISLSGV